MISVDGFTWGSIYCLGGYLIGCERELGIGIKL